MPEPRTTGEIRRFLEMCSYYRKYIQDMAKRTINLREESKGLGDVHEISEKARKEWLNMKAALVSAEVLWAIEKWQPFLRGRVFELVTDHLAIKAIKDVKNRNPMLLRMGLKLQGHQYKIRHEGGSRIPHVDNLSRSPVKEVAFFIGITRVDPVTGRKERVCRKTVEKALRQEHEDEKTKFIKAQYEDEWCKKMIEAVKERIGD
jgi:hypothetical protein